MIGRGVPVIDMHVEHTVAGERRVFSWSACRVTDNGQVLGVLASLTDVTDRAQAVTALRQANARLGLLERAGSQIGTTLDIRRTAEELADLAVPELADRVAIDLCDEVLQGERPGQDPRAGSGTLRLRRVPVRDTGGLTRSGMRGPRCTPGHAPGEPGPGGRVISQARCPWWLPGGAGRRAH